MASITVDDWNNLNSGNPQQIGFKVQEQINKIRRQSEHGSISGQMSTQGDHDASTNCVQSNSFSGISSSQRLALVSDNETVTRWLDARVWVESPHEIAIDSPVSTPSPKKTSVSEWVSYVHNHLIVLKEHEQMADRILLLANDIETNDGISVDEKSLATFIMFLSSNKIEKRPSIGLNSNGYIDALWRRSKDLLVEIVFFPGHESPIVTFSPDLVNPKVICKRVATLPIGNIMDVISNRNLDSLFYNNEAALAA